MKQRVLGVGAAVCAMALSLGGAAFAEESGDSAADGAAAAASSVTKSSAPAGVFAKGTKGIATAFPTGGDVVANVIYFRDAKTALNLGIGLTVAKGGGSDDPMMPASDDTVIGFSLRAGYRMLKPLSGRIRPYLEPQIIAGVDNLSEAADTLSLGAGAQLGVELMLMDQFTLGTGVGAALTTNQTFDSIALGLNTASITATFYWN